MRNVLWITGVWPPVNCGIGRQYKLAKYLPQHGWNPIVLAFDKSSFRPQTDYNLLNDLRHIRVYRTPSGESKLWQIWLPRLLRANPRRFNSPDPWYRWQKHALEWGRWIYEQDVHSTGEHKIDAMFSSAPPYTCHLVAQQLKTEFGTPWVADFRDFWTQQDSAYNRTTAREARMEKEVLEEANWITVVNQGVLDTMRIKHPYITEKSSAISHGFDPEDYRGLVRQEYDNRCTMTYAGTLYGNRTGGAVNFLRGLKEAVSKEPNIKVKVVFIGRCDAVRGTVKELGLEDRVVFIPWLSKRAVVERLAMSNVQLFILGESLVDRNASTGKIFEYMGVGRPVMAVAPEGVARKMIEETGIGTVDYPDDVKGIAERIKYWADGGEYRPVTKEIAKYGIREKAKEMAEVLERASK